MLSNDRTPDAPTSAADDTLVLHAPACVQRFSAQRRILARLQALTRRRGRSAPAPETESEPLALQVEENPNWPAAEDRLLEGLGTGLREWQVGGTNETPLLSDLLDQCGDEVLPEEDPGEAAGSEPQEDPSAAIIRQLEEDNRDLKAALCRLIRISEQNHVAIRLLEEENEELSTLAHRLTIGQTKAVATSGTQGEAPWRLGPWRLPAWGVEWLRRREARRCL
jgi:hypothetical protein